jgi:MoaA/NifB/PqqE/SkfB family radical SAM enzyme
MNTLTIKDKVISLIQHDCLMPCEKVGNLVRPFVDFSISITNSCNAKCKFCCNAGKNDFEFDVSAFKDVFDETASKVEINKVTFTGGEPTLHPETLNRCLDHITGRCKLITVNTNGYRLNVLTHSSITRISMSRHHDLDGENDAIFGIKIGNPLKTFSKKEKVIVVCNLIRGKVDCAKKAYDILEFASSNGVNEAALVGLMPLNSWSKEHVVSISSLDFDENVLCTRRLSHEVTGVCTCNNYVYVAKNGELVFFYTRHALRPEYNKGSRIAWENNRIV